MLCVQSNVVQAFRIVQYQKLLWQCAAVGFILLLGIDAHSLIPTESPLSSPVLPSAALERSNR